MREQGLKETDWETEKFLNGQKNKQNFLKNVLVLFTGKKDSLSPVWWFEKKMNISAPFCSFYREEISLMFGTLLNPLGSLSSFLSFFPF